MNLPHLLQLDVFHKSAVLEALTMKPNHYPITDAVAAEANKYESKEEVP